MWIDMCSPKKENGQQEIIIKNKGGRPKKVEKAKVLKKRKKPNKFEETNVEIEPSTKVQKVETDIICEIEPSVDK